MEATLWPYGKCKKCANKSYCAWSKSEILNCMNNGYQNFSPMRNADRLRSMSDEELAEWLAAYNERSVICPNFGAHDCQATCYQCWLDWLKQEANV